MKTLPILLATSLLVVAPLVSQSQTVIFNDAFNGSSTLNGTSTPGGTPSASYTSYDVASSKTGTCSTNASLLRMKLGGGTTAGGVELQALFASTPVQLVNVGDSINMTIVFTNSAGTLLAGGDKSVITVGLYYSGGTTPVAGGLNTSGLGSATTYVSGNCQNWQGYVAKINYSGKNSQIYTRPWQSAANNANQDLVFSGFGTGLYQTPAGTQIGANVTTGPTLATAKYTLNYTILLSAANTVSITNNLYDANGTLVFSQGGTTSGGTTYTNFANKYDGLAIGIYNAGTSYNPQMDISRITISTNSYFAPTISGLTNQTVIAGTSPTLNPSVSANPTASYQWQTNGVNIDGATSASLTLTNVQYAQDGYVYSLIATNAIGAVTNSMTLSVIVTPSISTLFNQAVYVGGTANISATVGGVPAPNLQWQVNGANLADGLNGNGSTISGSTTANLSIANAQAADSGTYSLIASNSAGLVTNSMYLLVSASDVAPTLVGPTNITVIQGNNGTFSISAYYGLPQPTLQWLDQTGTPILDATNNTLVLSNVQYSQNGYAYSCVASNTQGSVTNSATLTVIVPPVITSQPSNLTVTNTQSASFTVAATGVPSPVYQWYKNGSPIASGGNNSATNATFSIANTSPSDAGNYSVVITNAAGITNSVTVTLAINSTMAAMAFTPANGATNLCYDTPLTVTFSSAPSLGTSGSIKIYNVTNATTPVDTIAATNGVQQRTFSGDGQSFSYKTIVISGSTVTIYPHFSVLTSNQTYYVTIGNGTFTDAAGANFAGITATNVWQFTTKPGGPADPNNVVVNPDGTGDYLTVQGAVNDIPSGNTTPRVIGIRNGTYTELVNISGKHNITLRGQSRLGTLIGYPNNATFQSANNGSTHARMAFKVNANDISLDNLTITNMTPQGGSQAEALMVESSAKRCIVNNSEIDSRQDTILANGSSQSLTYFNNSKIAGNFDFIWGGGAMYFDKCSIVNIAGTGSGNISAARTDTSASSSANFPWLNPFGTFTANGVSFVGCTFTAEATVGNVTLAGSNGTSNNLVSWAGCKFSTNYVTPSASLFNGNFLFWQNQNTDLSNNPVSFSSLTAIGVTNNDPRLLAATNVTTWFYGWTPSLAPNILTNPANQTVFAGAPATFVVAATGIPNPTYQWQHAGTNVTDATNATLTIASAAYADAGSYAVIVTTSAGSVTSSMAVLTVNTPPNTAPVFTAPIPGTNFAINAGVNLSVACTASDSDMPAQTLTYSLSAGPTNSTLDSGSGLFAWRPLTTQAASTNTVTVIVTDNGTPNLSATNTFTVTVNSLAAPTTGTASFAGGQFSVNISGQVGPDYALQATTNLTGGTWTTVVTTNSPATMPVILTDPNAGSQPVQFYRIVTGPPLP